MAGETDFTGYSELSTQGAVLGLLVDGGAAESAGEGQTVEVVLDRTPFYAEAGGQLADHGLIQLHSGALVKVDDVQAPIKGLVVHRGRVVRGEVRVGGQALAEVDAQRRMAISRAHTAIHLVHKAFREALGETATQAGRRRARPVALYRPGPMAANSHIEYADRKNGRKPVTPIHPELAEPLADILGETYHVVVYQEQVMAIAQKLAGYSLGKADLLRRAMGKKKKEILDASYAEFMQGMTERDYSGQAAQALWDVLVPFAGYGFSKCHTAAYGTACYWTAYLKANYPAEYMAALLTSVGDDKDKMAVYLAECRKMGIKVLPPDVNESSLTFAPVGTDIRFGLGAVRNVGANVVSSIIKTRRAKGAFTSFADFLDKCQAVVCNKRVIESLIKAGAFDSLGHTRRGLIECHEQAVDAVIGLKRDEANGQPDLFSMVEPQQRAASVGLSLKPNPNEWDRKFLLAAEREMLGLYVSSHPLEGAEPVLSRNRDTTIAELLGSGHTEGEVRLAGVVAAVDRRVNKTNGNLWAIATVEDMDAAIEVLFFPKTYQLVGEALIEDTVIAVRGRLNERDGALSVFGQDLKILDIASELADSRPPVVLIVRAHVVTEAFTQELKQILLAHPG